MTRSASWACAFVAGMVVGVPAVGLLTTRVVAQRPEVAYRFHYPEATSETVTIELRWAEPLADTRSLIMPRAIPMGYGEQRYDAFLSDVRASGADGAWSTVEREEGPRWRLPRGTSAVRYLVNLRQLEREVTAASDQSRLRPGYLAALGYSVFAFVDGFESRPTRLTVDGPPGWPVFATLAPRWPVTTTRVDATTRDYYELADGQVIMGARAMFRRLSQRPRPLFLALYAEGEVDVDRLSRLATTAYERSIEYFGGTAFDHYTVHYELLLPISPRHEYGMSMEHLGSSTYYLAATAGLTAKSTPDDEARVLYNFAHHMAHAWVPKRAYGPGYFPFQWELAPVLDSIWFAEGFGQYAAIMALAPATPDPVTFRTGMLTRRFQANVDSAPAFLKRLPLVELSRVASTRYSEDFRTGRLVFSRGGLMAAEMDDRIRAETKGQKSLRDALQFLVSWTARERRAFAIEELPALVREATGADVSQVMTRWLAPLP